MKRVALLICVTVAIPVHGQPATGYRQPANNTSPLALTAAAKSFEGRAFITRAVVGTPGWFAGASAGAFIAVALPHHDCRCDDPGLKQAITGLFIGSTIGAAVGAAIPSLGRHCTYQTRFGRALIGSVAGTAIGVLVSIPTKQDLALLAIPIGSISGAALAIGRC
ncbi:MAG: hypothetical protein ABR582_08785 [Gemmatimonadaceae bacterium]